MGWWGYFIESINDLIGSLQLCNKWGANDFSLLNKKML